MNKIETNGFLRALEFQLQALESQIAEHSEASADPVDVDDE